MQDLSLLESLRQTVVLRHLPLGALDRLASQSELKVFHHDGVLIREADEGKVVFVVLEGRVAVRAGLSDVEDQILAIRGPGELVGEMALIDGMPRSAGVRAQSRVQALRVPSEVFLEALAGHPEASLDLLRSVSMRLRESDKAQIAALRGKAERLTSSNRRLSRENRQLRSSLDERFGFEAFEGSSREAEAVRTAARRAAESDLPVLLVGETGTGKELLARAIHAGSERGRRPMVALNCALFGEALLESELFGHARGAFTGAHATKRGLVEAAHEGTLFLDELADMPQTTQAALLRFLELGEYRRLGETQLRHADVRIVAATHTDPDAAVREGQLRRDLLYRLDVFRIAIPPLRERAGDVPVLAARMVEAVAERLECAPLELQPETLEALSAHAFPGNVRELRNEIERLYASGGAGARIGAADLSGRLRGGDPLSAATYSEAVRSFKIQMLRGALERSGGNRARAASALGLHRSNLVRMIRELEIDVPAAPRGKGS